jgi:hypothetical protein
MTDPSVFFSVLASLAALFFVLELVRRRRLSEQYSLLWLATAVVMLVLSVWRDGLHMLAALVGIAYPPNLLFLVALLFVLLLLLYFSVIITRLTRESKAAAQEIALLRVELDALRGAHRQPDGHRQQE